MSTVSLADARLLTRARSGAPDAVEAVWMQWRTPMWSVCRAMASDRPAAVGLLTELYRDLPTEVRGWARDESLCCHVATWTFRHLHARLELPELAGISVHVPDEASPPDPSQVLHKLDALSPHVRLVYLIDLFFGCPAATTAELLGVSEDAIRTARSSAAWALVTGGAP